MRSAMGGDAWNGVGQLSVIGNATVSGLRGSARLDDDLIGGRYGQYFSISEMGRTAEVYDGSNVWKQDVSGGVHRFDTPFARKRATTSAYLARRGYLEERTNATSTCVGTRLDGDRMLTVIRVRPRGGIPADLAIDARTHLLDSVSIQYPLASDDGVTRYSDYRAVDGLVLPFSISLGTPTSPTDGYTITVTGYRLQRIVRAADFAKPEVPATASIVGRSPATTVPIVLEGRQLLIWASIDGYKPLPFILDTGGHAILTTAAAKELGLQGKGAGASGGSGSGTISTQYARVKSVRIGAAELRDQTFLIIPYPYSFYERGKKTPLAGVLGLEVFERFVTRIDYGDRTVTLMLPSAYHHGRAGTRVPIMFEDREDMPVIESSADGHEGLFGTDTGNAGILILFGEFLKRTGLLAIYSGGRETYGAGTGGSNAGRTQTLRSFAVGGHTFYNVAGNFTQMTSGSFSSATEAGNMGFSILSRFIPTFDYATETLYLDPEHQGTPFGVNRSGLHFVKNEPGAFDIVLVDAKSAAADAGIVRGDRIESIDGRDASNYSWADLTAVVTKPAGTNLLLGIARGSARMDVTLVLR